MRGVADGLLHAGRVWQLDGRVLRTDDPEKISLGSMLDRDRRDRQPVVAVFDHDLAIDEIAGPQPGALVGKIGLQLDRAGRRVDDVVDRLDLAAIEQRDAVLLVGHHRQIGHARRYAGLRQGFGRHGDDDRDRLGLNDGDDVGVVGGADEIAGVDVPDAGAPVDRRSDDRIVELVLGELDLRVRLRDVGGVLADQRGLRVGLLLRGEILGEQLLIRHRLVFAFSSWAVARSLAACHCQHPRLIRRRIDGDQRIADLDVVPFAEIQLQDHAVDLRLGVDRIVGLHGADAGKQDRDGGLDNRRRHDAHHLVALGNGARRARSGGFGQRRQPDRRRLPGLDRAARDPRIDAAGNKHNSGQKEWISSPHIGAPMTMIMALTVSRSTGDGRTMWARGRRRKIGPGRRIGRAGRRWRRGIARPPLWDGGYKDMARATRRSDPALAAPSSRLRAPHPGDGPLAGDEVAVWWLATDAARPPDIRRWFATLDDDERARADRFHFEDDRRDFIAAHALLRALFDALLERPFDGLALHSEPGGKPRVDPGLGAPDVAFNLSIRAAWRRRRWPGAAPSASTSRRSTPPKPISRSRKTISLPPRWRCCGGRRRPAGRCASSACGR